MSAAPGRVGFVGLGMMGWPMASRLHAAGVALIAHDAVAATLMRFVNEHAGSVAATGPKDFAACKVAITMLPNSDVVDAVVLGTAGQPGLIGTLPGGAVVIDMSSSQPMRTRALAEALGKASKRFLDAPVSGGVKRAVDGSLAIMVGGDAAVFESQRALLAHLGKTLTHVGPAGAGHAVKALNNYVSAAGLAATAEALHVGQRFGLDPSVITDVLNSSTGRNNTTENKVKPFMLSGRFDSGFSMALMAKDLATAMELASSIGAPMRLGQEVLGLWSDADQALGKGADHTEMYRWLAPVPAQSAP
jgi:3-hydroxyisobutyrate dehydrogenase